MHRNDDYQGEDEGAEPPALLSTLLPNYAHIFRFAELNRIQATCFDSCFHSDSNLVIAAPTGGGKTMLFELCIIRLLNMQQGRQAGRVSGQEKVVYIAPMKALAQERLDDWSLRLGMVGLVCVELTGDSAFRADDMLAKLQSADVILTTPEKWDSVTRRFQDHRLLVSSVRCLLIDEVHMLGSPRGSCLESIICRMLYISKPGSKGQTAMLPNVDDLAAWLHASAWSFGEESRPVPLTSHVMSCPSNSCDYLFEQHLDSKVSSVIQHHSTGKPTLVFVSSRKGTQDLAGKLSQQLHHQRCRDTDLSLCSRIQDRALASLIQNHGVGYHHAMLEQEDRRLVELLFEDGKIAALCCTSTLAMGVNLPAHLVVIKGTSMYMGPGRGYQEIDQSTILQMMGRAGRPGYDTSGTAVIMTHQRTAPLYHEVKNGSLPVESTLLGNLLEVLNSEIALQTIENVPDGEWLHAVVWPYDDPFSAAIQWFKKTFLYRRISRGAAGYVDFEGSKDVDATANAKIRDSINELCAAGISIL